MISRREVVTAGVLGTLTGHAPVEAAAVQDEAAVLTKYLNELNTILRNIGSTLEFGQRGPNTASGLLSDVRARYTTHLRSAGKFPDFLEVGVDVFYDVYDWHVRNNQQIQITRISEQRFSILWMFTQLIVRFEQDPRYLGVPFDRA